MNSKIPLVEWLLIGILVALGIEYTVIAYGGKTPWILPIVIFYAAWVKFKMEVFRQEIITKQPKG